MLYLRMRDAYQLDRIISNPQWKKSLLPVPEELMSDPCLRLTFMEEDPPRALKLEPTFRNKTENVKRKI